MCVFKKSCFIWFALALFFVVACCLFACRFLVYALCVFRSFCVVEWLVFCVVWARLVVCDVCYLICLDGGLPCVLFVLALSVVLCRCVCVALNMFVAVWCCLECVVRVRVLFACVLWRVLRLVFVCFVWF